jgi:hypothetical protein
LNGNNLAAKGEGTATKRSTLASGLLVNSRFSGK